ncbi:MAG: DUF2892 domain-containing protein, partial [Nitrospira sp.]
MRKSIPFGEIMEINISMLERTARIIVGLLLAGWYMGFIGFTPAPPLNLVALLFNFLMLVTGISGLCLIY